MSCDALVFRPLTVEDFAAVLHCAVEALASTVRFRQLGATEADLRSHVGHILQHVLPLGLSVGAFQGDKCVALYIARDTCQSPPPFPKSCPGLEAWRAAMKKVHDAATPRIAFASGLVAFGELIAVAPKCRLKNLAWRVLRCAEAHLGQFLLDCPIFLKGMNLLLLFQPTGQQSVLNCMASLFTP
eukprot:TRINITY_DN10373_c0_g1_i1.p1 TRINITY_DN10373_c0_g1~~TRINITY_DN10373_c0_g1_i1.p1  ORF type:complete len:185 (+),score=24.87 TRINITY_DN10373_c0_g1_i1:50-604(+)